MAPTDYQKFYLTPWVKTALADQFKRRYMTMRWDGFMRRHYNYQEIEALKTYRVKLLGRPDEGQTPFFEVHGSWGSINNPVDIEYFINAGAQEFIPEVSYINDLDRTDTIIIDLDPKDPKMFDFEATRMATKIVHAALCVKGGPLDVNFKVLGWKFRFSGNRSFHIYIRLGRLYRFEELRTIVKENLNPVIEIYPHLSYTNLRGGKNGPPRTDFMLVDVGALARHRCVRSLWSLHHKTRMACIPVENLDTFDRKEAFVDAVLQKGAVSEVF